MATALAPTAVFLLKLNTNRGDYRAINAMPAQGDAAEDWA
jgi:hypothetical protein